MTRRPHVGAARLAASRARRFAAAFRNAWRASSGRGGGPRAGGGDSAAQPTAEVDYDRIETIVRSVADELWKRRLDLPDAMRELALRDSARFVLDNVPLHLAKGHYDLRRDSVLAAPDGLFMEFGVWQGNWLRQMAAVRETTFFGFDSFRGLPEPYSNVHQTGDFDMGGEPPQMPANVSLVTGWFEESLPPFLEDHTEQVAFVHVDCDLYSSTKTVLDLLAPRFVPGTQLVLDDFMYHPGWERAEHRAFFEFVEAHGWTFEYTGYASEWPACSVGVALTGRR